MKKNVYLLVGVIALYVLTSVILFAVYGPSVGLFDYEDYWRPDGNGGWAAVGSPSDAQPEVPSENVPMMVRYLPVFLPAMLLILFLFTPLGRLLDEKVPEESGETEIAEPPDGSTA